MAKLKTKIRSGQRGPGKSQSGARKAIMYTNGIPLTVTAFEAGLRRL